jgi:hypothetical protein
MLAVYYGRFRLFAVSEFVVLRLFELPLFEFMLGGEMFVAFDGIAGAAFVFEFVT